MAGAARSGWPGAKGSPPASPKKSKSDHTTRMRSQACCSTVTRNVRPRAKCRHRYVRDNGGVTDHTDHTTPTTPDQQPRTGGPWYRQAERRTEMTVKFAFL